VFPNHPHRLFPFFLSEKNTNGLKEPAFVTTLTMLYVVAVFSDIPFIVKWRTIYIETAMGTLSHHWLATVFIPKSVIDAVMSGNAQLDEAQKGLTSNWQSPPIPQRNLYQPWNKLQKKFFTLITRLIRTVFLRISINTATLCFRTISGHRRAV
jgi:hypothetical protein